MSAKKHRHRYVWKTGHLKGTDTKVRCGKCKCGEIRVYPFDDQQICLHCNKFMNPRKFVVYVQKWDFPVCQDCAIEYLGEIVGEELEKQLLL